MVRTQGPLQAVGCFLQTIIIYYLYIRRDSVFVIFPLQPLNKIKELNIGNIATISGRYYSMDRDNNYERIKLSYDVIVNGIGPKYKKAIDAWEDNQKQSITDEFIVPSIIDEKGNIQRVKQAFMADSIATTVGAVLGTSTTTTYVESAAGVAQGGRSGLTAFVVGGCFVVALFFSPLFLSIPSAATAPALIIVGLLMMEQVKYIPFDDFSESIPAFVCMIMMPLTYSISNGILIGMITYVLMNVICGKFKKLSPAIYVLAVLFILKYILI